MRKLSCLLSCLSLLALAGPASALPVSVEFRWGQTGGTTSQTLAFDETQLGEVDNGDGTFDYDGSTGTAGWGLTWDVTVDPDPFIDAVFGITNNQPFTQTFILTFTTPVAPPVVPSSITGASAIGNLTTNSIGPSPGGTLGHNGTNAMVTTIIDGVDFQTLLDFDSSVTLPFGSGSTGSDSFGLPGLTVPGPVVNSSIGIRLAFTLTPGDSASFTSRFEVLPIPEPGTALLLALGTAGLAISGRRRD